MKKIVFSLKSFYYDLLCFLGIHVWKTIEEKDVVYSKADITATFKKHILWLQTNYRECKNCGLIEKQLDNKKYYPVQNIDELLLYRRRIKKNRYHWYLKKK